METPRRYTSHAEAINAEIIAPLNAGASSADEYDVGAIADAWITATAPFEYTAASTDPETGPTRFWALAAEHTLPRYTGRLRPERNRVEDAETGEVVCDVAYLRIRPTGEAPGTPRLENTDTYRGATLRLDAVLCIDEDTLPVDHTPYLIGDGWYPITTPDDHDGEWTLVPARPHHHA